MRHSAKINRLPQIWLDKSFETYDKSILDEDTVGSDDEPVSSQGSSRVKRHKKVSKHQKSQPKRKIETTDSSSSSDSDDTPEPQIRRKESRRKRKSIKNLDEEKLEALEKLKEKRKMSKKREEESIKDKPKKDKKKHQSKKSQPIVIDIPDSQSQEESDSDNESGNQSSGTTPEEEFKVERIVKHRMRRGQIEYMIKWDGYSSSDNTWEPESNLTHSKDLLEEYHSTLKDGDFVGSKMSKIKEDLQKRMTEKFKQEIIEFCSKHGIPELENIPRVPPAEFECLKPRNWLNNFVLDDFINVIISKFPEKKIAYVDNHTFNYIHNPVLKHFEKNQSLEFVPNVCLEYIFKRNIISADVILVCCSTSGGTGDQSSQHWLLGVILKWEMQVILLDSMEDTKDNRLNVFRSLAALVYIIYRVANFTTDPLDWNYIYSSDCLPQDNNYDCGLFVCLNAFSILSGVHMAKVDSAFGRRFIYNILKDGNHTPHYMTHINMTNNSGVDPLIMGRTKSGVKDALLEMTPAIFIQETNELLLDLFKEKRSSSDDHSDDD